MWSVNTLPKPGWASRCTRTSAGTGLLLARILKSSSSLGLAVMTILSVSGWRVRSAGPANPRPRTLAASVLVVGGAVATVVAAIHRFLDRLLCSPSRMHLGLSLDGGWD